MAALTGSKRTNVIKSALTGYHWFVGRALTGSRVVARKATGEEVRKRSPSRPRELAALESRGNRLGNEELGLLAMQLSSASILIRLKRAESRNVSRVAFMEFRAMG